MQHMMHPDIESSAQVADLDAFRQVYAPRGWVLMDEATEFANLNLGRFVRSPEDLTKDEARALVATRGGDYPPEDATGDEAREAYTATFGDRRPAPAPVTESPTGIPLKPYDPSEHNVDEVVAHLAEVDEDEQVRIMTAEEAGKNRVTITGWEPPASADESAPAESEEN